MTVQSRETVGPKRGEMEVASWLPLTRRFDASSMRLDLDASSDDEHTPPPPPTIRELAFDIFSRTYSYELLAGTHEWLESLVEHFELADELNVRETFTHLAVGCKAGSYLLPLLLNGERS